MTTGHISQIDHLIYGAPQLEEGIQRIEDLFGVRPVFGGQHRDFGTHNALLKIGPVTYLEIIAPDPSLAPQQRPIWMGLERLQAPSLIWWAAKATDLDGQRQRAVRMGWKLGDPIDGNRKLPGGDTLSWQLTNPSCVTENGVLPFLIDWGSGPHPTDSLPDAECLISNFQLMHPQADKISNLLATVGLQIPVGYHAQARLQVEFLTPTAKILLKSY